jgi:hypothetical protein
MTRFARIRRRPDHWPTPHARARARAAERLDGPLGLAEASWLDEHLAGCPECAAIAAQYDMDRAALRGLREAAPEPPRDLWARTAAAIEREAGSHPATVPAGTAITPDGRTGRRSRGLTITALSGVAVAALVIGIGAVSSGVLPRGPEVAVLSTPDPTVAPASTAAVPDTTDAPSFDPQPTPLVANAGDVAWVRVAPDGVLAYTNAPIDRVCPADGRSGCATLDDEDEERIDLSSAPKSVISSPVDDQAIVISDDGQGGDRLVVVSLPERGFPPRETPPPGASPTPTPSADASADVSPTPTPTPTPEVTPSDSVEPTASPDPGASATPQPMLTPEPTVATSLALASDITLVGQSAAFSSGGDWFAFTARPTDGSSGPDVYVWRVGDEQAIRLTDDGASVFASWAADAVLVSRPADVSAGTGTSSVTVAIDPTTGAETAIDGAAWRPAVDPSGERAVVWSGTVSFDAESRTWRPAEGRLELIAWPADDGAGNASPQVVIEGPVADLDVRWDETGAWVAVWVADSLDSDVGRLTLYRVDPLTGQLDRLKGAPVEEPALAGFSIGDGRVAWVGPSGEDGEGSHIHVAAWVGRDVGTAESVPGQGIVIIR